MLEFVNINPANGLVAKVEIAAVAFGSLAMTEKAQKMRTRHPFRVRNNPVHPLTGIDRVHFGEHLL